MVDEGGHRWRWLSDVPTYTEVSLVSGCHWLSVVVTVNVQELAVVVSSGRWYFSWMAVNNGDGGQR